MQLEFTPDIKCNVTYIVADGYRLTLSNGFNNVPDEDWAKIKADPEIKRLVDVGDIIPAAEPPSAKPANKKPE